MATSQAWQAELRGLLIGAGTVYSWTGYRDNVESRASSLPKLLADGEFQGFQTASGIVVDIEVQVRGTTKATLVAAVEALKVAWHPSAVAPITLEVNAEGTGAQTCTGFPRISVPNYVGETVAGFLLRGVQLQFVSGQSSWT